MKRVLPLVILAGCTFSIGITGDGGTTDTGSGATSDSATDDGLVSPLGDATPSDATPPIDAPSPIDAFVPVDAGPPWVTLETITVPCSGVPVVSQTTLSSTVTYRIRASGLCVIDRVFGADVLADAEYYGVLIARDSDNGVDMGIAIDDVTLGSIKLPRWGSYVSSHVYEVSQLGQNAAITLRYHDKANNAYGDNVGSLQIEILAQ